MKMNTAHAISPRRGEPLSAAALGLIATMVLFATILRGGNRGVALIALEWLALGAGLALIWRWLESGRGPATGSNADRVAIWTLALSPLWLVGTQTLLGQTGVPGASGFSAMAGVPVTVCMLAAWLASDLQAITMRKLWLGVALAQAVFGITQLSGVEALFFGFNTSEPVIGTFASKNTYANLLVMAIPLAVFQFMDAFADRRDRSRKALWGWGMTIFVLVVTVMLTTSRTGIATGLLVLLLSVALLRPAGGEGGRSGGLWWWVGFAGLIVVVLMAGGLEWAARFDADRLSSDADFRGLMRAATAQGAQAYLPLGTGLGSYAWVSSAIQPPETGRYWMDLAHNDYTQLLMDTGVLGAALLVLVFSLYFRRWWGLLRSPRKPGETWPRQQRAAMACGIGLLAFALHAWVDYPFHIPANAMMAATLFGLMLRCERSDAEALKGRPRGYSGTAFR
jgi:O-antigen ligase